MKAKKLIYAMTLVAVFLAAVLLLSACTSTNKTASKDTVKIGYLAPLTGIGAYWGGPNIQGAQIAQDEINAAGGINGIPLNVIVEDSMTDSKQSVLAVNKLLNVDKVDAVITEFANIASTIGPIMKDHKTPFVYDAYVTSVLEGNPYAFKTAFDAETECARMTEYAKENNMYENLGILVADVEYGQLCLKGVRSVQPDAKAYLYTFGDTDFKTMMAKAKNDGIDSLAIMAFTAEIENLYTQMVEQDYEFNFMCGSASECLFSDLFDTIPEEALEGSIAFDYADIGSTDFGKKYYEMYPGATTQELLPAAAGYEQTMLIAEAAKMCDDVSRECIRENLANVKEYSSPLGSTGFENRVLQIDSKLYTAHNGQIVAIN